VVGAGLSGIGAGHHLRTTCPGHTFAILESRSTIGGTWDLFRYPGVRSDSDMFTLSYQFRPWTGRQSISDGPAILDYIQETAAELGVEERVRYGHRVTSAAWSSEQAIWDVETTVDGQERHFTCSFLYLCCGYYDYDHGYSPAFPDQERFAGQMVHPQKWSESVDVAGRSVVVIGSGATAVTLAPALAERAGHVTLLQRSPTYMISLPSDDPLADLARKWIPWRHTYRLIRSRNIIVTLAFYQLCRRAPRATRGRLVEMVRRQLPEGYPVDTDFTPRYDPWDERLCVVRDGDLFSAIRQGGVSVVTGTIDRFTERGVLLDSGEELPADVVVSATGLELLAFGGIALAVDGRRVDPGHTFVYRGFMLAGVPNLAICFGYTNASWTLRADLASRNVCRLLRLTRRRGWAVVRPPVPPDGTEELPLLDLDAGYVRRSAERMPKRSARGWWRVRQNYLLDVAVSRLRGIGAGLEVPGPSIVGPERSTGPAPDDWVRPGSETVGTEIRP
jgi:cation diffusion facilitator CzcD-associated flavoprotein CzcO